MELGKIPTAYSGDAGNAYTSKWPFFKSLLFLKDIATPRCSTGNLTLNNQEKTNTIPYGDQIEIEDMEDIVNEDNYQVSEPLSPESSRCSLGMRKKRRHLTTFNEAMLAIEQEKHYLKQSTNETKEGDDEHLLFFKSLLPHVCRIPQHIQLTLRNRIHEVVEQFAYHTQPHHHHSIHYLLKAKLRS